MTQTCPHPSPLGLLLAGFLIHYDDMNQDLQDFYFIDPKWLCELMARVVTLREVNPFIINGILNRKDFAVTFKGERFPEENYPQFIRLLNRFQIACSLDEERLLVPSKLPAKKPEKATDADLPFITIKRVHSFPFMPYGFWNRFTARLLCYTKDMLMSDISKDVWSQHVKYKSPYQLDPFCCRCPLTVSDPDPAKADAPAPAQPSLQPSGVSDDLRGSGIAAKETRHTVDGFSAYFDDDLPPRRGGFFVNGMFISGLSGSDHSSPRSDSGFGYSSGDEDSTQEQPFLPRGDSVPPATRRAEWHDVHLPKHGSNPESRLRRKLEDELDMATPRSESAVPYDHEPVASQCSPPSGNLDACVKSPPSGLSSSEYSGHVANNLMAQTSAAESSLTSHVTCPMSAVEARDYDSSRSTTEGAHPLVSGVSANTSAAVPIPEGTYSFTSHIMKPTDAQEALEHSPPQSTPSSCAISMETCFQFPLSAAPSVSSEPVRSLSSSSCDVSSLSVTQDDVFVASTSSPPGSTVPLAHSKFSKEEPRGPQTREELSGDGEPDQGHSSCRGLPDYAKNGPSELDPSLGLNKDHFKVRSISHLAQTHRLGCPCAEDFPIDGLPELPTDLCTLVDSGFLHCWLTGVCLHHPRLFFMVSNSPDLSQEGRQCIITQVSPSPLGRRILSYIVDHIDTLIREWYPDLSLTDGREPIVRQQIPCVTCEHLGVEAHKFSFVQCQRQSSVSDMIACPNHDDLDLNLHHVAPDIMLHDVGVDLLVSHDQLKYENSEASLLGSGGFGKVQDRIDRKPRTCSGERISLDVLVAVKSFGRP